MVFGSHWGGAEAWVSIRAGRFAKSVFTMSMCIKATTAAFTSCTQSIRGDAVRRRASDICRGKGKTSGRSACATCHWERRVRYEQYEHHGPDRK